MYIEEKFTIAISVGIAIVGILVEWNWETSNAIARSGSVIVCAGIIFGFMDLKRAYGDKLDQLLQDLESKRMETDIVFSDEQLEDKNLRGSTDGAKNVAKSTTEKADKRVALVDMLILISGTIIWGFGDLLLQN